MRVQGAGLPLVSALLVLSSAAAQERSVNLLDEAVIANGSKLFQMNCAVGYCHGSEGRSARGPAGERVVAARFLLLPARRAPSRRALPSPRERRVP